MPHGNAAGAAEVPPATATAALSSEPLATWTRSDDKLLEMLIVRYFTLQWDFIASRLMGDKTPEQTYRRYEHTVQEVTHALQALHVETPREWDMPMAVPASSRAVVVPVAAAADAVTSAGEEVAAAEEIARVPPSSAADSGTSEPRSMKKRKRGGERKKPEKWTELEHRYSIYTSLPSDKRVRAGLDLKQAGYRLCFQHSVALMTWLNCPCIRFTKLFFFCQAN